MARYRPYVEAVQWTGINVIEIRQFIRANKGAVNDATIIDGVLVLFPVGAAPVVTPLVTISVPVNNWIVIREGGEILNLDTVSFLARYELAL